MKRKIPLPGQRILRTAVAVWLCLAVYELRGRQGLPFFSTIAVLQCIQPYTKSMHTVAFKRLIGTLIGAFWGMACLLLELRLSGYALPRAWLHYALIALFTAVVIYFTVLIRMTEAAYFSALVFLAVVVNFTADTLPYALVYNRILDTALGIAIAEIVNSVQLPRRRNTDTLFVSGMNDTIFGMGKSLSPYAKVELNRLIQDGAQFTISTIQTPATVRELLVGVDIRLPIIVMDGAAMYDMRKMTYLKTFHMGEDAARRMTELLDRSGLCYLTNSIEENILMVHCGKMGEGALRELFESKRNTPHRNFISSRKRDYHNLVYFMVLDEREKVEALYEEIRRLDAGGVYRLAYDDAKRYAGARCLKIYAAKASRKRMLRLLAMRRGLHRIVTFGSVRGAYDVVIEDADKDSCVKELKRRFAPVDFRCWKNILRF